MIKKYEMNRIVMNSLFALAMMFLFKPCVASVTTDDKSGWFTTFRQRVVSTWNSDGLDIHLPTYTWHNRLAYDERISRYNEFTWGAGLGRSVIDENDNEHALYAFGFADSNNKFQPIVGYIFMKNNYPLKSQDFVLGYGYTLGFTGRYEYLYIPIPVPLPIFCVGYKSLTLRATYLPGPKNDFNVLFCWFVIRHIF